MSLGVTVDEGLDQVKGQFEGCLAGRALRVPIRVRTSGLLQEKLLEGDGLPAQVEIERVGKDIETEETALELRHVQPAG